MNEGIKAEDRFFLENCSMVTSDLSKHEYVDILIDDGRIVNIDKAGRNRGYLRRGASRIDIGGSPVLPSFIDSHMHLFQWSLSRNAVDLGDCLSDREVFRRISDVVEGKIENRLFLRSGFLFAVDMDDSTFKRCSIDRRTLDSISNEFPIMIRRICGHKVFMNSRALDLINDLEDLPDDGVLVEEDAMRISWGPNLEKDTIIDLLSEGMEAMFGMGVTGGVEILPGSRLSLFNECYQSSPSRMDLTLSIDLSRDVVPIKVPSIISWDQEIQNTNGQPPVVFGKMFMDGSIGARTASFSNNFTDSLRVPPLMDGSELKEKVELSREMGLVPMVHAIGDCAVSLSLDVLSDDDLPYRLEHVELISDRDIQRTTSSNGVICSQPNFVYRWGRSSGLYEKAMGDRYLKMNRFSDMGKKGARIIFGTDMMPPGPLSAIRGALDHPSALQRFDLLEVIRSFTNRSYRYSLLPQSSGFGIDNGSKADLIVLSRDLSSVLWTFHKGKVVHHAYGGPDS